MIYTDSQLKEKIVRMIESFENEVVEFKELNDEQLDKIVGGDRRDPRGMIGIGKKLFG